ncbi:Protein of uncharacterised function (DUF1572) [Sphingobacterium spiritivorum]|uniref:Protein of uncharacterized function (DUF1572) n=1 Tax=Sphingobacterium spiritivorum TaxID=258 RepID=A0A380BMB8_SPHSI|nr:DUF1572 family protein [Sphingobacterium spiritivorum]SUJ02685.1 Protein of uncharacterised function (DUF1572) [Sphingobacterium spiritivorum]
MLIDTLQTLFERDLQKLRIEILLYKHEENLWIAEKGIANSAGNLCLHLIGNLNTYIGAEIGKTGYIRHRELEFSLRDIPRAELIRHLDNTITTIRDSLNTLSESDLDKEYPILVFDQKTSVMYFLVHLTTHLAYHLGQINYHRRLLDGWD